MRDLRRALLDYVNRRVRKKFCLFSGIRQAMPVVTHSAMNEQTRRLCTAFDDNNLISGLTVSSSKPTTRRFRRHISGPLTCPPQGEKRATSLGWPHLIGSDVGRSRSVRFNHLHNVVSSAKPKQISLLCRNQYIPHHWNVLPKKSISTSGVLFQ